MFGNPCSVAIAAAVSIAVDRVKSGRASAALRMDLPTSCARLAPCGKGAERRVELLPAVSEDLLEAVLGDMTSCCHAPQSSQPHSYVKSQGASQKRKFLWDQVIALAAVLDVSYSWLLVGQEEGARES
jgi:hypothetical protein